MRHISYLYLKYLIDILHVLNKLSTIKCTTVKTHLRSQSTPCLQGRLYLLCRQMVAGKQVNRQQVTLTGTQTTNAFKITGSTVCTVELKSHEAQSVEMTYFWSSWRRLYTR